MRLFSVFTPHLVNAFIRPVRVRVSVYESLPNRYSAL